MILVLIPKIVHQKIVSYVTYCFVIILEMIQKKKSSNKIIYVL